MPVQLPESSQAQARTVGVYDTPPFWRTRKAWIVAGAAILGAVASYASYLFFFAR